MGAWGVGMKASDAALDAVDVWVDKRKLPEEDDDQGVLGVGEHILDGGGDVGGLRKRLDAAIERELTPDRLGCWRSPNGRRAALERFRDRLDGRPVDPDALASDNEGLLSKIARSERGD